MRRASLLLLLLALGSLAISACGKGGVRTVTVQASGTQTGGASGGSSGGGSGSTGGGSAGGPKTGPSTPPGKAQSPSRRRALAFAEAVNLTADDVPGFTPSSKHDTSSAHEKKLERELIHCTGAVGSGEGHLPGEGESVAEQSSKEFELKRGIIDFSVSSQVSVQPSAAGARKALQAIRSAHVRNCFSHYLQLLFAGERVKGATPGPVSIQAGIPPAPGTSGGFGWRITASFTVRGIKVPIYVDFLGFVDGPAEVTLLSSGLIRPFPAEVQQRLFSLLLARAKEHAL